MRCVIRVDASISLGVGHVMRCLTLALQIRSQGGAEVQFICRDVPGHLAEIITRKGFRVVLLPEDNDGFKSFSWLADAQQVLNNFPVEEADWLVVDHYEIDARWEVMLRSRAKHILVIDDLADRPHDCDVLLDQNYRLNLAHRYDGLVPPNCTKLLGPRYLLLRPEFINARKSLRRDYSTVKRILVNFGGTDEPNLTMRAVNAIQSLQLPNLFVDVVVGQTNPHQAALQQEVRALSGFAFHLQTDRMAALICAADLAIGASGSSTWERCSLGLPTLALVLADNQREAARELGEAGIIVNLGDARDVPVTALASELDKLIKDRLRRIALSSRSLKVVPGDQPSIAQLLTHTGGPND
jgi:UDP-2,4-diacetamido-2,4,6-trideoxy-beta-L-altropyranose hydrolase